MTRRILIAGGLGYVGGRVAQALVDQPGVQLRLGLRHPPTSPPPWFSRVESVPLDLLSGDTLEAACRGVQEVINLAAMNEIHSAADPEQALRVNGAGALKLLQAAQAAGAARFIQFSTAHVYGAPLAGIITEKNLTRPVHPYAITHRVAEDFVLAARDRGLIGGLVIRLSNGIGPPAHPGVDRWTLVVNDLCRQAVLTGKLRLRTSGLQWRDFIALTDVARAVLHFQKLADSAWADGLFNLGAGRSMRILDLAQEIARRCQAELGFTPAIDRPEAAVSEDFPPLDYRIDKLTATGFQPRNDFTAEIDATLRFCRDRWGAPPP
jgi:UDP-glucose 4-epimerase